MADRKTFVVSWPRIVFRMLGLIYPFLGVVSLTQTVDEHNIPHSVAYEETRDSLYTQYHLVMR